MTIQTPADRLQELRDAIADGVQTGASHGSFVDFMVEQKWDNAKLRADAFSRQHFDELQRFAIEMLAVARSTLDKRLDREAAGALYALIGSFPFGAASSPALNKLKGSRAYEEPRSLRDFVDALTEIRDGVKAFLESNDQELRTYHELRRDVASMRRVLGIGDSK